MTSPAVTEEIEAIIARTALKYDLLPYQSKPFAQSQPSRLGAIARLFDLGVAPLETARVLELGCASGGNIIPHAINYPNATFVGVDLARTQVAAGRARIAKLGLTNIEIHCQSFTEIGDELGSFDYIICHGVYSWVPEAVQEAIFKVIRARLSDVGVACVSYNVLPGWRMYQPLRDAFMLQIPDGVDSIGRVAQARELLNFLKDATPDKGPYGEMLRAWAGRMATLPDDYIAHEFLEECNLPTTVRDFTRSAARYGLGYLGECEVSSMILDNYGPQVAAQIRARAGNDLIESEQYLDLLSGRTFRQSLLVSSERMAKVNRGLSSQRLEALQFVLNGTFEVKGLDDGGTITDSLGRTLTTASKAVIQGFEKLIERYPSTSSLDDLVPANAKAKRAELADALYSMVVAGMVQIASEAVNAGKGKGKSPVAIEIARLDAAEGQAMTTNLRHESVMLDPACQVLLPLMDGTNNLAALEAALVDGARSGRLVFNRDGVVISDLAKVAEMAAELLPNLLAGLAASGLIKP